MASLGVDFTTYTRPDPVEKFGGNLRKLNALCIWKYKKGPTYEYQCPHLSVAATVWYLDPDLVIKFHNSFTGKG